MACEGREEHLELPAWLDIIIRSFVMLVTLFLLTKLIGKKQLSQLSIFEYIAGITIGSVAAEISTGLQKDFLHGVYSLLVWTIVPFTINLVSLKSKKLRDLLEGKATVLIKEGKIYEENVKKQRYTTDELLELLRKKDVFNVADVEFAILEADGNLNVLLKKEKQPLTPQDIQLTVAPEKQPETVIMDGNILDEPLSASGYNRRWLQAELEKLDVTTDNVFLGQIDSYGQLTVDLYDDQIQVPRPQEKPLLLATLKKCQADFELYSLATESADAKSMYSKNAQRLEALIQKTTPFLQN